MTTYSASDRRLLSKTMFAKPSTAGIAPLAKRMAQAEAKRRTGAKGGKKQ